MLKIGEYNKLKIARELNFGLFLEDRDEEVLLPKKFIPKNYKIGDELEVFVYTDSEDRPVATTQIPNALVGEFGYLRVVDSNKFGAFLDWGLDKDLFVPFSKQDEKMQIGKSYLVKLELDKEKRVIGDNRVKSLLKRKAIGLKIGQEVDLMIYEFSNVGAFVIINNEFLGLLFSNEIYEKLEVGEKKIGYIKNIREDGKIDVTLRQVGQKAVDSDREVVLSILKREKEVTFTYKSSPEAIKEKFKMSRKAFKRVLTNLLNDKLIELGENSIKLRD